MKTEHEKNCDYAETLGMIARAGGKAKSPLADFHLTDGLKYWASSEIEGSAMVKAWKEGWDKADEAARTGKVTNGIA